ncbi:MAG: SH3 domain-containing protein [Deltaproteobacteria bacterium]|nr:SH3 domain-containing protein [Deltaproteobacteria bacterium]
MLKGKIGGLMLVGFLLLLLGGGEARAVIRDLKELSQNPAAYLDRGTADRPLLLPEVQGRLSGEYERLYFAPWHQAEPRHTLEQVTWGFREYGANPGFAKNGQKRSAAWVREMAANAHLEDYPQGGFPAVLVKRADFRVLPTGESHSSYPNPASGYAFDNLQESSEPEGTPILVTQVSRDRKWVLAETSATLGWIPASAAAQVDQAFMRRWENGKPVAFVLDDIPVRDERGAFLFQAPLGAIFPKIGERDGRVSILTAVRDKQGKAQLRNGWVKRAAVADKPLPFTAGRVAALAAALAGEPYRWGGLDGKRDCSALVQDLFAPFGLWLPRNSREQAGAGRFVSFKDLAPAEKEALIIRQGVPWRTLLWTPGHIMLYIGVHQGRPLIFHNFWSIKTRDAAGKQGRIIVGRASVTTLHPGRELPDLDLPRADVLYGLAGMTLLGEPPESGAPVPEAAP